MRTIQILDTTYAELSVILKDQQPGQIKQYGEPICKAPEDMIPWLLGYYKGAQKSLKKEPSKIIDADEVQKHV